MYFDTHAHICDEKFDGDREELLKRLPECGLSLVLDVCCSPEYFRLTNECCQSFGYLRAAYGIHPHEAGEMTDGDLDVLSDCLKGAECVALGEIGLDYHYDFCPRETQRKRFAEQLELSAAAKKPVIIHDREAHADTLAILRQFKGRVYGVMHCYSGSAEMTRDFLDLGFYISFAGAVTFANGNKTQLAAQAVPADRILIETDCPYLTPAPHRGKRNDPSYIRHTCEKIAQLRGVSHEQFALQTLENGKALFGIK